MNFSPEFLDEIKRRVSLVDVVARTIRLKERGRGDYWGLSPFTKEKTPSFHVLADKGFYKCFSTQNSGDIFTWLVEVEGLSFPEAVEKLAGEAGLEIPQDRPEDRERQQKRKGLADANELACAHFERLLRMPEGRGALDYLRKRGLDDAMIKSWRLGFAPNGRGHLKTAMAREKVSEDVLIEGGLLRKPENGDPYDWFRGRVMFPIQDRRGQVIAFGGRILGDGEPKYLNSPETPLFQKRFALYGVHRASAPARKSGRIIVCEGYMDVIGLARAGIDNAVAPLGTALTDDQLRDMWRIAREPVLCFDGDRAGQRAAFRAAERALPLIQAGHSLRFAIMPAGEDPDSLVQSQGRGAFEELLENALPLSEIVWRQVSGGRVPTSPEDRADVQKRLNDYGRDISDATYRKHFNAFVERKLGGSAPAYAPRGGQKSSWQGKKGFKVQGAVSNDAISETSGLASADVLQARILITTLLNHPDLFDDIEERLGMIEFSSTELDNLRQQLLNSLSVDPNLDSATLYNHLSEIGFERLLPSLVSKNVYIHARFARPESEREEALSGWMDTYTRFQAEAAQNEMNEAETALGHDMSEQAFGRLKALKIK